MVEAEYRGNDYIRLVHHSFVSFLTIGPFVSSCRFDVLLREDMILVFGLAPDGSCYLYPIPREVPRQNGVCESEDVE